MAIENSVEIAKQYGEWGLEVFPLVPRAKTPIKGSAGFKEATSDVGEIEHLWSTTGNRDSNIGCRVPEGIVVLDIDSKEALYSLHALHEIPKTVSVKTPKGYHYWFKYSGPDPGPTTNLFKESEDSPLSKIDTRSRNSYVVLPPSSIPGAHYVWEMFDNENWLEDVEPAPAWLQALLLSRRRARDSFAIEDKVDKDSILEGKVPVGQRNDEIYKLACSLRANNMSRPMAKVLVMSACAKNGLAEYEGQKILDSAWKHNPSNNRYAGISDEPKKVGRILSMADVEAEEVDWLWEPYIPRGEITLFAGPGGLGKSWGSAAIAAAVSRGTKFLDISRRGKVVIFSAEDDLRTVLGPRLRGLGADPNNIFMYELPPDGLTVDSEMLLEITKAVADIRPELVVIDPIVAFAGGGVDMFRANEVREVFSGFQAVANTYKSTFLVIHHTSKSGSVYGSVDFVNASRSVLRIFEDPTDPSGRYIAHQKTNYGRPGATVRYRIGDDNKLYWDRYDSYWTYKNLSGTEVSGADAVLIQEIESEIDSVLEEHGQIYSHEMGKIRSGIGVQQHLMNVARIRMGLTIAKDAKGNYVYRRVKNG